MIEVHYEEWGEGNGGTPLLLIPGIPAVANDWTPLAEAMAARGRRVISYDNRGSGQSPTTPGPYTTAQLAQDGADLLDRLGIETVDVFGMSMGGMIAQELALNHPQRVRRLVLGCTHAGVRHAARPPRAAGMAFAMETDDWGTRIAALAPFAFASDVDNGFLKGFISKKSLDVQDPDGYQAQIAAVLQHDARDRLPQIAAPTLILTGDDDRVIPGESSETLRDGIPDARLEVIEGTGHLFFIEAPERTTELLVDFLRP